VVVLWDAIESLPWDATKLFTPKEKNNSDVHKACYFKPVELLIHFLISLVLFD